jgi:hypothetical protein
MFCEGGAALVLDATQNTKFVGLSVAFWAIAVSMQPRAINSTKAIQVMDLKEVFTSFSTVQTVYCLILSNRDTNIGGDAYMAKNHTYKFENYDGFHFGSRGGRAPWRIVLCAGA